MSPKNKKSGESISSFAKDEQTFKEMEASINGLRVALNMQVTLVLDLSKNLKQLNKHFSIYKAKLN